jgi:hypothetical protein
MTLRPGAASRVRCARQKSFSKSETSGSISGDTPFMKLPVQLRFLAGAIALAVTLASPASAAGIDHSDLWWNPQESGWGAGIQRQGDVIFLTLFLYGSDGSSTWLVAPDMRSDTAQRTWLGSLYRTSGAGFATAFDAAQATQAGDAALEFDDAESATMRYTVDGQSVTKRVSRMTWREPSAAGSYRGGFSAAIETCADVTRIGAYDLHGPLTVGHSGSQVSVALTSSAEGLPSTCTFTGTSRQSGRLGRWSGTFSCTVIIGSDDRGEETARTTRSGTFTLDRIAVTSHGFHGTLTAADQDCVMNGYLGGTRLP